MVSITSNTTMKERNLLMNRHVKILEADDNNKKWIDNV